ncbi:MAG: sulfatase [Bacteroidota bacterium]
MSTRLLLLCSLCWVACQNQPTEEIAPDTDSLNIVWIVAEDLSPVIPPFGDSTIVTPNLNRLAAEGVSYTHFFSPSGVCAPSRAAIATGMYPTRIGANHMRTGPWYRLITDSVLNARDQNYRMEGIPYYEAVPPAGVHTHSTYLRKAGYYCSNNAKEDYQFRRELTAWDESSEAAHWRNRAAGQAFFAIFNLEVTHESRIWKKAEDTLLVPEDLAVPIPPYLPDTEVGRRDIRRMYSNILEMDQQVGEIIAELEAEQLLDKTIIFWYADHGGPLPRQKRLLYDSGIRSPLIVRFPDGRSANTVDDQMLNFIDLKPTILSLAGIQPPDYVDGKAWLGPYAEEEKRSYVYAAADRFDEERCRRRAVRDHRYKYIRNYLPGQPRYLPLAYREQMPIMQELLRLQAEGALSPEQAIWFDPNAPAEELYDLQLDPHELHNLAADPSYADQLEALSEELDRWLAEAEDLNLGPEKDFLQSIRPGGVQVQTTMPQIELGAAGLQLSCSTAGASIGYQWLAPGERPTERWQPFVEAIETVADKVLVVRAHRIGYLPSLPAIWTANGLEIAEDYDPYQGSDFY